MSYNSILAELLGHKSRERQIFPSLFEKPILAGGSQVLEDEFNVKVSFEFKELMNESTSAQYESQIDKPWTSAKTVKAHFYWGDRDGGKTTGMERTAEDYYREGLNIWHVWGARSYENWFWPVNKNCQAKWKNVANLPEEMQEELRGRLHCSCHEAIPTVLIFPEYKEVDIYSVHRFNGRVWKSIEEYKQAVADGIIPMELKFGERKLLYEGKLFKPDYLQPKIDLIKIAYVSIPANTQESQEIFKKQWIKIILSAREENRVVAVTPQIFEGDSDKFRVIGEIFKLIPDIADEYFQKLTPEQVGQMRGVDHPVPEEGTETDAEWTPREKGWNKIVIVANELGTIAPNNKYSRQIESKQAKRPIVDMIPELRHLGSGVWFLGDLQNPDDLNSSVRPQSNNVVVKRATKELLGSEFELFFKKIDEIRHREFYRFGFEVNGPEDERFIPSEVKNYVNSRYPRIEELPKNKGYVLFRNGEFFLETFDMPSFHHRKEGESFRQMTGIKWTLNKKKLGKEDDESPKKSGKSGGVKARKEAENKVLKVAIKLKKSGMHWSDVLIELQKMETNEEIPKTKVTSLSNQSISNKIRDSDELTALLESKDNV